MGRKTQVLILVFNCSICGLLAGLAGIGIVLILTLIVFGVIESLEKSITK